MDSEKEGPRRARAGTAEKTLPLPSSHNVCAKEVGCWISVLATWREGLVCLSGERAIGKISGLANGPHITVFPLSRYPQWLGQCPIYSKLKINHD